MSSNGNIFTEAITSAITQAMSQITPSVVLATVNAVDSSGVTITIDGDTSGTKKYISNRDARFTSGEKVLAARVSGTYVIICRVGAPSGVAAKTSAMTQSVGRDTNGALWTAPPSQSDTDKLVSGTYSLTLSSKVLTPSVASSSSNSISLGSSTYPLGAVYLGAYGANVQLGYKVSSTYSSSEGAQIRIGSANTYCTLGFFGATPVKLQQFELTRNVSYSSVTASNYLYAINNVVNALINYGLIDT